MNKIKLISAFVLTSLILVSCGGDKKDNTASEKKAATVASEIIDPAIDKGVGPITSIEIGALDQALADKGKAIFTAKCTACHKIEKRYIGPALKGITKKQTPEWIMNMILNPENMIANNATAKALLAEFNAPMANQNLTQDEARAVYEYFRTQE